MDMQIETKNLTHIYGAGTAFERVAIKDLNITIEKGEFVGLIGHTGSGKSTLVQHLNSLLKPSSGEIFIDGENINADKAKLKAVRRKVGLVFQYPEHQLFEETVFKDVAFGPQNMGFKADEVKLRVEKALNIVDIGPEMHEKSPFELSGGQKRRVAIAGVLAMQPEILILDEPTAGLDPKGRDEILLRIKKMHETLGITVILVSHSMEDIGRLVGRVIVMHNARVALCGTPGEVFAQRELLEAIGLGVPQTSKLMHVLKTCGLNIAEDIFTVEAATEILYNLLTNKQDMGA